MTKRKLKKKYFILLLITTIILVLLIGVFGVYLFLSSPVDKNSKAIIQVEIKSGMNTNQIGRLLEEKKIIRSSFIFKLKLKMKKYTLKASTYDLKKTMSLDEVINILAKGNSYNPNSVRVTFKEGQTIKQYAKVISEKTSNSYDEVISLVNDEEFLNKCIQKYWFIDEVILDPSIYYKLEGYLAPDTYEFNDKSTDVMTIVMDMLDEMDKKLSGFKDQIVSSGKSIHEVLTLASIVELEGTNKENRKMIAGVFYNRLNQGMNLGSDVTTYYGAQQEMTADLTAEQFSEENMYNTRSATMAGKLPIGPICNPSKEAIDAVLNPTSNDYFYFVADKNKKIYYSKTSIEHSNKIKEIKEAGNWIW